VDKVNQSVTVIPAWELNAVSGFCVLLCGAIGCEQPTVCDAAWGGEGHRCFLCYYLVRYVRFDIQI